MPISQDKLNRLPEQAREDVRAIYETLRNRLVYVVEEEAFERLVDAYADCIRDKRTAEQHRRDLFVASALSGLCARGFSSELAGQAVRAADETLYSLDAPDLLATLRGQVALLEGEVERLKERVANYDKWDKTGLYEHAHEDTIPEVASPEQTRKRLEQLVAIVKAAKSDIDAGGGKALHRALSAVCDELLPMFAKAEASK